MATKSPASSRLRLAALPLALAALTGCAGAGAERSANDLLSAAKDPIFIPEAQEVAMGLETAASALKQYPLHPAKGLQDYVSGVGRRLAAASDRPGLAYTFTVVDSPQVNAFACPGGPVFITTGILRKLKDEAELAAVLGHEVGHVVRQHGLRRMQRAMVAQLGLGLLQGTMGDKSGFLKLAGPFAANLLLLRNGREAELESDEQGLQNASRIGYDPSAMVGVQEMLMAQGAGGQGLFAEVFASHPPSEARIAQARALLPRFAGPSERGAAAYKKAVLDRLL